MFEYFEAILELRWNIAKGKENLGMPLSDEKVSKLKAKRQGHVAASDDNKENQVPQCPEQVKEQIVLESPFAALVGPNARSTRYTGTELRTCVNSYKSDKDFLPHRSDICLDQFLPDITTDLTREQALLKLSLDMPYLSLLEKNASYFVST